MFPYKGTILKENIMTFTNSIAAKIKKLVGELKSEEQLREVLKRKFTKKEFKVFIAMEDKEDIKAIAKEINNDEKRVEEIYKAACKKLNQEILKRELVNL